MPRQILKYIETVDNVVWDWNGTLLNDLEVTLKAEAKYFPLYGVTPPTPERRNEIFCFPIRTYYERVGFDFTRHNFEKLNAEFMSLYEKILEEAPLFEGMIDLIEEIQALGKRQFILSAAPETHLKKLLHERKIDHLFEGIYGLPHQNADSKISRGRDLTRDFALNPQRTLLIGDTDHDYEVATALGFQALLLADGHKPYEKLAAIHHQVLRSRYGTDAKHRD